MGDPMNSERVLKNPPGGATFVPGPLLCEPFLYSVGHGSATFFHGWPNGSVEKIEGPHLR